MNRKGTKALLLILLLCGLTACANQALLKEQAANHLNIGSAYLSSGQYNGALKEFMEAGKLTPDDPKVHYLIGISYHRKGLNDLAIDEFQRSLALNPDDSEVHNYLGAVYMDKGRWDDAIASFNRALNNILYDNPSTSLYNLGRAYYEKGEYDRALKYYQEAMEKDPYTFWMPLIEKNMGMTWIAKGDTEQAIRHLLKSIDLAPSLVESHYWLGLCYRKQNRTAEAVQAFQTVARMAPESEFGRKAKEQLKTLIP